MINKQDIITRLQAGSTMDEIVDDITKTINDAQDEYKAIQEKQEEARKLEAEAKEVDRVVAAKYEAACMMLDGLCDYLVVTGEDELLEEIHQVDIGKVVELVDSSIELTKSLIKLKDVQIEVAPFNFLGKWLG